MIYQSGEFYAAMCDCCSNLWQDKFEGWNLLPDSGDLKDEINNDEWLVTDNEKGEIYCPDCYETDEEDKIYFKCDQL